MNISKEDFEAFKDVQDCGDTNMFDLTNVSNMSGLSKEKIRHIMENYDDLIEVEK